VKYNIKRGENPMDLDEFDKTPTKFWGEKHGYKDQKPPSQVGSPKENHNIERKLEIDIDKISQNSSRKTDQAQSIGKTEPAERFVFESNKIASAEELAAPPDEISSPYHSAPLTEMAPDIPLAEAVNDMVRDRAAEARLQNHRRMTRSKTSQRLKYEAETKVLRRKMGNLEQIRIGLALSQRKICQLLLVDPSAWTRWIKLEHDGFSAPPHIYRALSWYLAMSDKYPALDVGFWLNTVSRAPALRDDQGIAALEIAHLKLSSYDTDFKALSRQLERKLEIYQKRTENLEGELASLQNEKATDRVENAAPRFDINSRIQNRSPMIALAAALLLAVGFLIGRWF
jgi:hypothetical protein